MSNAIVKPKQDSAVTALKKYLEGRQANLAKFAVAKVRPETMIRLALFEFSQNSYLRSCSPESIYSSLILAAQLGLEPSGVRGEAYLVPFKGVCTLMPGWRGLIKLALRSRAVKQIYAHVAYERDKFEVHLGSEPKVIHEVYLGGDRGEMIAAYAVARLENGEIDVEVMTIEELSKIRESASRGGRESPAYKDWWDQMARKAPIRRLCKRLPVEDLTATALRVDEMVESGQPERVPEIIDGVALESGEVEDRQQDRQDMNQQLKDQLVQRAKDARDGK